jgi:hypothetical protein
MQHREFFWISMSTAMHKRPRRRCVSCITAATNRGRSLRSCRRPHYMTIYGLPPHTNGALHDLVTRMLSVSRGGASLWAQCHTVL